MYKQNEFPQRGVPPIPQCESWNFSISVLPAQLSDGSVDNATKIFDSLSEERVIRAGDSVVYLSVL